MSRFFPTISANTSLLTAALAAGTLATLLLAAGCSKESSGFTDADGTHVGTAPDGTVFGSPCDGNNCVGGLCLDGLCQPPGSGPGAAPGFPDPDCENGFDPSSPAACQCAPDCISSSIGNGSGSAFSLTEPGTRYDGIAVDPVTGELVLESSSIENAYIWISNTTQGTVSKINTRTFVEEGRYAMGPAASLNADNDAKNSHNGDCNISANNNSAGCEDPSRTSVNGAGDVFVGLRSRGGVVKVKGDAERCPDTNGDGTVTTSNGRTNILQYGSDDCVLWRTIFPGSKQRVRAVAAQDIPSLDFGQPRSIVWVGDDDGAGTIWKVDGETGEVLLTITNPPAAPYGMALDGNGQLWISGRNGNAANRRALGRIDTTRCDSDNCGGASFCNTDASFSNCSDAIMQRIDVGDRYTYGITVDGKGRVWMAVNRDNLQGGRIRAVVRYSTAASASGIGAVESNGQAFDCSQRGGTCTTPIAPGSSLENYRWLEVRTPTFREPRGVTASPNHKLFVAMSSGGDIVEIDTDNPGTPSTIQNSSTGDNWGMATDVDGHVWTVGRNQALPRIFDLDGTRLNVGVGAQDISLRGPYTYSDMTGSQLRLATNPAGRYSRVFEGCSDAGEVTTWQAAGWIGQVPEGASMMLYVRSAATVPGLEDESFVKLAEVPPDTSPASIHALFESSSMTHERFLEVEVRLSAGVEVNGRRLSPRVSALDVGFTCERPAGGLI